MILRRLFLASAAALLVARADAAKPVKPAADILPPDHRRALVEKAERLAQTPAPIPVPAEVPGPFNPPGFDRPDTPQGGEASGQKAADGKPAAPALPQTDQELLAAVAAKIPTTGTMIIGGKPLLISGTHRIEAGSRFTVVYNGQDYELELVAIDRTTFTVRYKGEEFTRPIKQGKTP